MLNNILKHSGVKKLNKSMQQSINGGDQTPGMGFCYDPNTWWYEHPCGEICNDGETYPQFCS
ncbi:hypothetical protein J8281_17740 [Aquimarina sp. U1-2]|uniref:hypothetical protein n=1 Tax=Aquimarina sp. U1-2 TaxID=2823141 RepID=UPI001AECAEA9|nr:hypothetical protein [Aquimarina sp. U1-2]MBP2834043.1 hypothetical protein [Aquimarina sp. U1-2]